MCRSNQLGSADKAAVRRLVTGAFQRVIATGGQSLGEVRHLSVAAVAHAGSTRRNATVILSAAAWSTGCRAQAAFAFFMSLLWMFGQ